MTDVEQPSPAETRRQRLFDPKHYLPWVRAEASQMPDCFLYWIPVSGFPIRHDEKNWISEFLNRLSASLEQSSGLRGEVFLQYKSVQGDLVNPFFHYTQKSLRLMGVGRHLKEDLPSFPNPDEVRKLLEDSKQVDVKEWLGEFTYWFVSKQPVQQRELFLGHGGMTTIFLPPDPKTKAPRIPFTPALRASLPIFQQFDIDATHAATYAMQDSFLKKSKELFGAGLETRPEYPGISFILPLLDSAHFFVADADLRKQWFELFDVYVNESKKDKGVLLAFQKETYEPLLFDVLDSMRNDGLTYPEEKLWRS